MPLCHATDRGRQSACRLRLSEAVTGASDDRKETPRPHRDRVLSAGMMELKAECRALAAQTAGSFVGPARLCANRISQGKDSPVTLAIRHPTASSRAGRCYGHGSPISETW